MRSLLIKLDKKLELRAHRLNQEVVHLRLEALIPLLMIVVRLIVILAHPHPLLGIEEEEDLQKDVLVLVSAELIPKGEGQDHHGGDK